MSILRETGRLVFSSINALLLVLALAAMSFGQSDAVSDGLLIPGGLPEIKAFCPWLQDPGGNNLSISEISSAELSIQGKAPLTQLQIDSLDTLGAVEFNKEFSSQRSVGELFQAVSDATNFSADSGRTIIVSLARSKQAQDGTEYKNTVVAGFDPMGSQGLLVGSGTTSTLVSDANAGWAAAVGFSNATAAGTIVSKVRVDAQSLERYFSSETFGQIELNSSAVSGSENSQQNYSQTISVNGDSSISQTTRVSFGNDLSDICPWQRHP